jgi:hypothetical protein
VASAAMAAAAGGRFVAVIHAGSVRARPRPRPAVVSSTMVIAFAATAASVFTPSVCARAVLVVSIAVVVVAACSVMVIHAGRVRARPRPRPPRPAVLAGRPDSASVCPPNLMRLRALGCVPPETLCVSILATVTLCDARFALPSWRAARVRTAR